MADFAIIEREITRYLGPKVWAQGILALAGENEGVARAEITKASPEQRNALVAEIARQSDLIKRFGSDSAEPINARGCSLVREAV